MTLEK
jgi:hypothetical protein